MACRLSAIKHNEICMSNEQSPFHNLNIEENPVLEVSAQEDELKQELQQYMQEFEQINSESNLVDRARLMLNIAECHLGLDQRDLAWEWSRPTVRDFVDNHQWQLAAEACDILYNCHQDDSIIALGNGIWLAVTYPVDANISVNLLHHIVDETPDDSDGAAVAAMLAHYLAEIRAPEAEHANLTFVTGQIVAQVAKRHRGIEDQDTLNTWIKMYQLDDLQELLPRMSLILETITDGKWWYDREKLKAELPVN